ncbi:MAG: hypothetical protein HYV29_06145 [Ignavibacteriales bacterium]|nr:hypothetical protein [Ignavibacteriales bacterium]
MYAQSMRKSAEDDASKYTNIGNLGVTITNYGHLGNRHLTWPNQPSAEYPKGSGIEHLSIGGIWIGGYPRNETVARVATAAVDNVSRNRLLAGYELTNNLGTVIRQRSTLGESPYFIPFDPASSDNAISHQDFVMDFTDRNTRIPETGDSIPDHIPLGVDIHLESYAWNFPFADFFVILNYTIKNGSSTIIDSLHVGLWNNGAVRNTKLTGNPLSASQFFSHSARGYVDSLRLSYVFDFDGAPYGPPANSYLGIKLLGTSPFPLNRDSIGSLVIRERDSLGDLTKNTYYNGWRFASSGTSNQVYAFPDFEDNPGDPYRGRFQRLSRKMPRPNIDALGRQNNPNPADDILPASLSDLISVGPFRSLAPGERVQVVFALIGAKKFGSGAASQDYQNPQLRRNLYSNASWAQQAYDGEDLNGNNTLDTGEDINGNGKLDRFSLPQPPRQPRLRTVVENQKVTLYWDRVQAEESFDPISRKFDFEGYRVYRSLPGADIQSPENFLLSMNLVGEYDRTDNFVGYNTGFSSIKLDSAKKFPGDTVEYWYQFPPKGDNITSLNGWQYLFGVSAFDQGDSANGLPSLESATVVKRVVPGVTAVSDNSKEIGVYPNPYYANAAWDAGGERTRKIYFTNLPAKSVIKIFTMTGDLVAELQHDGATYDGSGIKWFEDFKTTGVPAEFAGGEHAWDLITKYDQAIATGLYLFTVKDLNTGDVKRGKFVIVK